MMFPDQRGGKVEHQQYHWHGVQRNFTAAAVKSFVAHDPKHDQERKADDSGLDRVDDDTCGGQRDEFQVVQCEEQRVDGTLTEINFTNSNNFLAVMQKIQIGADSI